MGNAMRPLLDAIGVPYEEIATLADLERLATLAAQVSQGKTAFAILHPSLWKPA
jgi:hypothetical protein